MNLKQELQKYKQLAEIYQRCYSSLSYDIGVKERLSRELDGELTTNEIMTDYILHLEKEVENLKNILTIHQISYK